MTGLRIEILFFLKFFPNNKLNILVLSNTTPHTTIENKSFDFLILFYESFKENLDFIIEMVQKEKFLVGFPVLILGTIGVLAILLNVYILAARAHRNYFERKRKRLFDKWSEKLFLILEEKAALYEILILVNDNDTEKEFFTEFLIYYLETIKGQNWKVICQIFQKAGLVERELEILQTDENNWRCAMAAYRLGQVKAKEALPTLLETVRTDNNMLAYSAAASILNLEEKESTYETLKFLLSHKSFSEEQFAEIILGHGSLVTSELIDLTSLYEKLPLTRYMIIDFFGYFKTLNAAPFLIKLLKKSKETEEKIRLVKALGNIMSIEAIPTLKNCLKEENPIIRSQAAKALGNFEDEENIHFLAPLLEDRDWWCRNHATIGIMKIGKTGREFLQQKFEETQDPYAKDMINQILQNFHG